jgi:hypothetical protein
LANKQCCLFLPQCIKLQFIISSQVTQFLDVKWCQPRTTANQIRFRCLSCGKFILLILPYRKMVWVLLLQLLKQQVNRIFEIFIILPSIKFSWGYPLKELRSSAPLFISSWIMVAKSFFTLSLSVFAPAFSTYTVLSPNLKVA